MKKIIIILLVSAGMSVQAAQPINVGIMFGTDYTIPYGQKIDLAMDYETFLNRALTNSGIHDKEFLVHAVEPQILVNPAIHTNASLLGWIKSENQRANSTVQTARNSNYGIHGGLDVLVLVARGYQTNGCGSAYTPPNSVGTNKSETHAFAVVIESPGCSNRTANTLSHEIGHVLYSEHELQEVLTDSNGQITLPNTKNHGLITSTGAKSIMVGSHAVQPPGYRFSGSSGFTEDLTYSNVKSWIRGNVWDAVASYRLPPPPPRPNLLINWVNGLCYNPFFEVTYSVPNGAVFQNCKVYPSSPSGVITGGAVLVSSLPACVLLNLPPGEYVAQCSNGDVLGEISEVEVAGHPSCSPNPNPGGWNGW